MGESKKPPLAGTHIIRSDEKQDTTNTPINTDNLHTNNGGGPSGQKGGAVEATRGETLASTEEGGRGGTGEEGMTDVWEGFGDDMVGEIRTGNFTMDEYEEINILLGLKNNDDKEGGMEGKRRKVQ